MEKIKWFPEQETVRYCNGTRENAQKKMLHSIYGDYRKVSITKDKLERAYQVLDEIWDKYCDWYESLTFEERDFMPDFIPDVLEWYYSRTSRMSQPLWLRQLVVIMALTNDVDADVTPEFPGLPKEDVEKNYLGMKKAIDKKKTLWRLVNTFDGGYVNGIFAVHY